MSLRVKKTAGIVIAALALAACGSDTTTSPNGTVSGSYTATQFVTTGSSGQTNQLLQGSTVNIQLLPDGTTTGHLHLVASAANPALDADLAGTWTQTGNTVTFTQDSDTFVGDLTFSVVANGNAWQLVADQVFAGTRVQLTLTQIIAL